ncbi:hypothetical protein VNO78_33621 [Psophocarpus tetragonolobus]|uniref:Cytochrome P450 n=1 Tax=Psophocarpus tetragonolobus TaxID=3891 RepID=A0AAN9P1H4_PSOTE
MKIEVERLLKEIIDSRKDSVEMGISNSYGNDFLGILLDEIKKGGDLSTTSLSIWIAILAIHHSEELWGKYVNEFNPERFGSKPFMLGCFTPFAFGPRNCVGQSFAMMEAKIILVMLISRFSFTIYENYRHAPLVVLTIKYKYDVQVCLKPLESYS